MTILPFGTRAEDPKVIEFLNLSYGKHERQVLDIVSSQSCLSGPVLVFFHGGSWRWGQKDYHREIGKQFARKGIVFVTANYRLYPEVRFPAFPEDVALATAWVRKKVQAYGGNGENIFLMGHSAGAHSACLVGLDPVYLKAHGGGLDWLRGVVSMSAPYEFDPSKEFLYRDLFPPNIERNSTMPAFQVGRNKAPPFLLMHGKFDPLIKYELCEKFSQALKESGSAVESKIYASHGHFSLIRRTSSWHIWPKPLLGDVIDFIERFGIPREPDLLK